MLALSRCPAPGKVFLVKKKIEIKRRAEPVGCWVLGVSTVCPAAGSSLQLYPGGSRPSAFTVSAEMSVSHLPDFALNACRSSFCDEFVLFQNVRLLSAKGGWI